MTGAFDRRLVLSYANHFNFNQWIDEYFHESTSKYDLTDMDPLERIYNPEEYFDRLGDPEECFDDCDLAHLMSPTMPPEPSAAPAAGTDVSVTAKAESPEIYDFIGLGNDGIAGQDAGGGSTEEGVLEDSISNVLTPAAQSLQITNMKPTLAEYQQESQLVKTQAQGHQSQTYSQDPCQLQPQVQSQYQLPVHVQDHTQAQFDGHVQTQALPYQPFLHQPYNYANQYIQGNYQPLNFHSQGIVPSQPDPPQTQPQPQYHFPSAMPSFNTNLPQPPRPPIEQPPKKYRAPPQPTAQNTHQAWLVPKLEHFTHQYQGYISTPSAARGIESVFLSLSHPPETATTTRHTVDVSFPRTTQEYRNRVRQMFEAICDWSSPREWRAKMGHTTAAQWIEKVKRERQSRGLSTKMSDLTDEDLAPPASAMPPVEEQWKNVIHRRLSDIEIELLCAKVLLNKVLIHSALRASWISRITNSPFSETRRKDQNKAGNDRKRTLIEQVENGRKRAVNEQGGGKQKRARI
ncbi:hypothetical protein FSPOR_2012 [Fusarium sporotrichioides]|uniref:Uncharacterized protein n=1 Tax=Fusarium sporotrichioides TaxID=5514 RepID=A0A395SLU6_FUSSP|nr:hypothetical protein FSPOR_2012 [Fusarium sporotrichioides]